MKLSVINERLKVIAAERERWTTRSAAAEHQIAALETRATEAAAELETMADLPSMIEDQRVKLMDRVADADRDRKVAADQLAAADTAHREAAAALRRAHALVSTEREARARIEAHLEGARTRRSDEVRRIRETLDCAPDDCVALAEIAPGAALPVLGDADRSLQKIIVLCSAAQPAKNL